MAVMIAAYVLIAGVMAGLHSVTAALGDCISVVFPAVIADSIAVGIHVCSAYGTLAMMPSIYMMCKGRHGSQRRNTQNQGQHSYCKLFHFVIPPCQLFLRCFSTGILK